MAVKTKKITVQSGDRWHVRDENDAVFGPVDFLTLKGWVEDGRVSPLSRLSSDNCESWTAAVDMSALEMDCIAEIDPGSFYGPIHRKAMDELIRAGSIPSSALIYSKRSGDAGDSGSASEMDAARRRAEERTEALAAECASLRTSGAKLASERQALLSEVDTLRSECEVRRARLDTLAAERDALHAQNDRLTQSNGEFVAAVEELRQETERVASAYKQRCAEVAALEDQIQALHSELALSRRSADEARSALDEARSALREERAELDAELARLKSRESELLEEGRTRQLERDAFRQSVREQQKLLEEREKLHRAEQRERQSAWDLQLENLVIEHESAVNSMRHEYLAQIQALHDEIRGHQEEIRALRRINEALEEEKSLVSRRLETTDRQSRQEHDVSGAELLKRERRIAELAIELQELEKTNQLLKAEFIRFEQQERSENRLDLSARRRLAVLQRLFAEAAALLEGAGEEERMPAEQPAEDASVPCDAELLAYEEIEPDDAPHGVKASFLKRSAPPPADSGEARSDDAVPPAEDGGKSTPGGGRQWPFGKGRRKDIDRQALAELEAQARNELQRLSASGDIGAIFDRKK